MAASIARGSGRYARMVVGVGALALTAGFMAPAALATQGVSQLLVSNTTTLTDGVTTDAVTLDVQGVDDPSSATVYVGLDSSCPNVFVDKSGHGQTYTMMSSFDVAGIASVNPSADVPNLICTSATPFLITAVSAGVTTLSFNPGATNHGLQKKVSGPATVTVTVVDSGSTGGTGCPADPTACPTTGSNPAAPAVANFIFNMPDNTAISACKAQFPGKNNWRGSAISGVAHIMPTPESIKDTYSFADWEQQVYNMLAVVCNYPAETVS